VRSLIDIALGESWGWRIVNEDGVVFDVFYLPEATQREVEQEYPGAICTPIPEKESGNVL